MNDENTIALELENLPKSILIVEDDSALSEFLVSELKNRDFEKVDIANDGIQAWGKCEKNKYDFILLDWKIPLLSSLAIINRLKQDGDNKNIPILIMSGFLKKKDFALLAEFHNTDSIEKPFTINELMKKIIELYKESLWYEQQEEEIFTLIESIGPDNIKDVEKVLKIIDQSSSPISMYIIFSRVLIARECYVEAEKILKKGLLFEENIILLSELGKLFLIQGESARAKEVLLKASKSSPENMDRICILGELELRELNLSEAKKHFTQANDIDSENMRAKSGNVLANNIETLMSESVSIPETFAGILNVIGINMVRNEEISSGIEHYNSALLHVNSLVDKAKLSFNLGLAYLRDKNTFEASEWFRKALLFKPDYDKAKTYIKKINSAMNIKPQNNNKNNKSVKLKTVKKSQLEKTSGAEDEEFSIDTSNEPEDSMLGSLFMEGGKEEEVELI